MYERRQLPSGWFLYSATVTVIATVLADERWHWQGAGLPAVILTALGLAYLKFWWSEQTPERQQWLATWGGLAFWILASLGFSWVMWTAMPWGWALVLIGDFVGLPWLVWWGLKHR